MVLADPIDVACMVSETLTRLGVPHLVGGSVASSLHGIPRATQDLDLVADLHPTHVRKLAEALEETFYIDEDMILAAIRQRRSFNVIHLASMMKVDCFVLRQDSYARQEMARRQDLIVGEEPPRSIPVASPEDIILQKLVWYQRGGGVSERQLMDVLGVIKVQNDRLDLAYLLRWAAQLGVADLLDKALEDGGICGQNKST